MNELAIVLHKNNEVDTALKYYKKALLCMKRKHKNKYVIQPETAKIIINIATLYYMQSNIKEAIYYYKHALDVLYKVAIKDQEVYEQRGKVHMSLANLNKVQGNLQEAKLHYQACIEQFEPCDQKNEVRIESESEQMAVVEHVTISDLMLEARHEIKQIENNALGGVFSMKRNRK